MMKKYKTNSIPLLSVIVPFYNTEGYISECLDSVCAQDLENVEVILINDGSTDSSLEIAKKYKNNHKCINIINHKSNRGLVASRNTGLFAAKGTFIVYIDSDDKVKKDYFKNISLILSKNNSLDLIIYRWAALVDGKCCPYSSFAWQDLSDNFTGLLNNETLMANYKWHAFSPTYTLLPAWRCVFRRSLLLKNYCTDENIIIGEDYCFTYRCLYKSRQIYVSDKSFYYYLMNRQDSNMYTYYSDLYHISIMFEYLFKEWEKYDPVIKSILQQYFINCTYDVFFKNLKFGLRINNKNIDKIQKISLHKYWHTSKLVKNSKEIKFDKIANKTQLKDYSNLCQKIQAYIVKKRHYYLYFIFIRLYEYWLRQKILLKKKLFLK